MKESVQVHDLTFVPMIASSEIQERINAIAKVLKMRYANKKPLFLGVLNGAFMFAADLMRACDFECEITFIKLSSYRGMTSTGNITNVIGLSEEIKDRHVIIVEDIIDSGKTMNKLIPDLKDLAPASIEVAALLVKPDAMEHHVDVAYTCFSIPNDFVIGYGLDYDGLARNYKDIYTLKK